MGEKILRKKWRKWRSEGEGEGEKVEGEGGRRKGDERRDGRGGRNGGDGRRGRGMEAEGGRGCVDGEGVVEEARQREGLKGCG